MKRIFKYFSIGLIVIFACIGFFLTVGYVAVRFGWTNTSGVIDNQRQDFLNSGTAGLEGQKNSQIQQDSQNLSWQQTPEWSTLKLAIIKDQDVIKRAAYDAGVSPRLIVENLIGEQLRFFFDDRESYKKFFAPLKILGSETQFSWGVMGVKENTAVMIENNLHANNKDKNTIENSTNTSPFYFGPSFEHLLDFNTSSSSQGSISGTSSINQQRFTRMTDQHNHYWSYLYAGLYIHQIEHQWQVAGFDISTNAHIRPDIIATLYNVGFANSHPNADPQSGGALIPVGGKQWSFGSLAASFYNSDELLNEFPR